MKLTSPRWWLDRANSVLSPWNLKIDTLTAANVEAQRLQGVEARQGFSRPIFPLPASFESQAYRVILDELPKFRFRFDSFEDPAANDVAYQYDNGYFSSPDAEVLYAMIRLHQPRKVLEIGCGHSTKLIRQAIKDGGFACEHTCIDPHPRQDVSALADAVIEKPIETTDADQLAASLGAGDVLFIDTSHEVKPANDVAFIYGCLLPKIASGVIVHIHDIFLPFDYPRGWVIEQGLNWGEQYLVQTMLSQPNNWEVLWPGFYLQQTLPDFDSFFHNTRGCVCQSLWLRNGAPKSARVELKNLPANLNRRELRDPSELVDAGQQREIWARRTKTSGVDTVLARFKDPSRFQVEFSDYMNELGQSIGRNGRVTVCEMGCEFGVTSLLLSSKIFKKHCLDLNFRALDVLTKAAAQLGDDMETHHENMFRTSFPDASFDVVFNNGVLEHYSIEERKLALRECARIVAPGGKVIIGVPNHFSPPYRCAYLLRTWMTLWPYPEENKIRDFSAELRDVPSLEMKRILFLDKETIFTYLPRSQFTAIPFRLLDRLMNFEPYLRVIELQKTAAPGSPES